MRDSLGLAVLLLLLTAILSACVPLPQRVADEFSPPDGERPNNFEIRRAEGDATRDTLQPPREKESRQE